MCPSVDVNKTLELPLEDVVLPHRDNSGERISISPPRNEKGEAQPVHVRVIVHKLHKGKVSVLSLCFLCNDKAIAVFLYLRKLMDLVRKG